MNLKFDNKGNILVVTVNEIKFTYLTASNFRDRVEKQIEEGATNILIDLEKVTYIDSSAIGAITAVFNYLNQYGESNEIKVNFAVCSINSSIELLFSILHIKSVINVYENQEVALAQMILNQ